jgi:hypothetical protein
MINKTEQYNWQKATAVDKVRFGGKASPNILAIKDHLIKRYGGSNVGIVSKREVRGGGSLSTHYFGAALDWRYGTRASAMNAMKEMIAHSQEWGIQMIVDYVAGTVWTPKKGWRKQEPNKHGMGQAWAKWLHIETTKSSWGVKTPLVNRL